MDRHYLSLLQNFYFVVFWVHLLWYSILWFWEKKNRNRNISIFKHISCNANYFYFFPVLLCAVTMGSLTMVLKEIASSPMKLYIDFANRIRRKWCGVLNLCLHTGYIHIRSWSHFSLLDKIYNSKFPETVQRSPEL